MKNFLPVKSGIFLLSAFLDEKSGDQRDELVRSHGTDEETVVTADTREPLLPALCCSRCGLL